MAIVDAAVPRLVVGRYVQVGYVAAKAGKAAGLDSNDRDERMQVLEMVRTAPGVLEVVAYAPLRSAALASAE